MSIAGGNILRESGSLDNIIINNADNETFFIAR